MTTYKQHLNTARTYYKLMDEARALGIPVDLADPRSPRTIEAIRVAVETMK